jgi:hypothetical protein
MEKLGMLKWEKEDFRQAEKGKSWVSFGIIEKCFKKGPACFGN